MSLVLSTGAAWQPTGARALFYNPRGPDAIAGVAPTLDYRFALDRNEIDAVSLTDKLTVTTVDADGTFTDSAGTIRNATTNSPRFDHDSSTKISRGLLVEATRTNPIRNNTMQGADARTPLFPTGWSDYYNEVNVTKVGVEDGINFIDARFNFGAPGGTGTRFVVIEFENPFNISASPNSIWSLSAYVTLVGGSTSGITAFRLAMQNMSSGGTLLSQFANTTFTPESAPLRTKRYIATSASTSFTSTSTAHLLPYVQVNLPNTNSCDITLRIGEPHLELAASASSVIRTKTAAVTRSADDIKIAAGASVITGTYTMVEKPAGCATVSGTDILLNEGFTAERVMVFPTSLSAAQITAVRAAM